MSSLYTINQQLLDTLDISTGEIVDEKAYNALQLEREEKIENIALWFKNLTSEAEALKAEEKAFADRRKSAESKAQYLKDLLDRELKGQKFNTVKASISYRKSTSVEVQDVDKLPEEYRKTVTTVSADKAAIKEAFKRGDVSGATLVESNNIQIK